MSDRYLILSLMLIALGLLAAASLFGSTPLGFGQVMGGIFGTGTPQDRIILWEIRLPRAFAALLVGLSLGMSGAALQGLLRNPLAEPGVLGVSASASLFATVALYYGFIGFSTLSLPIAAILGAVLATLLLLIAARKTQSMVTLILIGVGLSSFAGAAMTLLLNLAPNPFFLSDLINWTLGSVANRSLNDIALALPFMALGAGFLLVSRRGLMALTLGEEAAESAGLNLKQQRLFVVLGAGLMTGASVALAGAIGFVGIVAPHLMRARVDYDPARLLIPSALLGGIILLLADISIRLMPTPNELKLGVVAALFGAPLFIWIAANRRAGSP